MRIIGLDFGSKTVGVAVSDELGLTAQGEEDAVYTVVEQEQELNAVAKIFAELLGEEADIEMS